MKKTKQTSQEKARIIQIVADYQWPWQVFDWNENEKLHWISEKNQDFYNLIKQISLRYRVRLDPTHQWDWPIETRQGYPAWAKFIDSPNFGKAYCAGKRTVFIAGQSEWMADGRVRKIEQDLYLFAPHPLSPWLFPPTELTSFGRRILK